MGAGELARAPKASCFKGLFPIFRRLGGEFCRCARGISISQIPLALGGGMGYTISVLSLKGEMTDYSRGSDGEQP